MVKYIIYADFPTDRDSYLHRVGRAGRFGTRGLAINFVKPDEEENSDHPSDKQILTEVQKGFKAEVKELPNELDSSNFM